MKLSSFDSEKTNGGLLAGITVVTLEQAVSAPLCTRTLADFGARVIKVENPLGGDFCRDYDNVVRGLGAHFVWVNRGKESITLDLKMQAGRDVLHKLISRSDAFVSNLGPGALTRLGVGADSFALRYPDLITLEISGYGVDGPLAGKRAYDLLVQAESGACAITGWAGSPAKPGPPMADACTGLYGAITILAGLCGRNGRTGLAASVSMFDTMAELMGYALTYTRHAGIEQEPVGLASPAVAPYGGYRTADAEIVILGTTNNKEWQRLSAMIGRPDLGADARFESNQGRVEHRELLDGAVSEWCSQRTLRDVQAAADTAEIGNARYNTPSDVVKHPHLAERNRWREIHSPVGPITALLPPPIIEGYEPVMGAVPGLGEHTDPILTELGYQAKEIEQLRLSGVVGPRTAYTSATTARPAG